MPVSGVTINQIEFHWPREHFWDRFAEDVSATCIHFSDYEGLSKFECPETSHLDVSDVEEFTNNLLNILEEKQFFER